MPEIVVWANDVNEMMKDRTSSIAFFMLDYF
jgi:hypothetical protein